MAERSSRHMPGVGVSCAGTLDAADLRTGNIPAAPSCNQRHQVHYHCELGDQLQPWFQNPAGPSSRQVHTGDHQGAVAREQWNTTLSILLLLSANHQEDRRNDAKIRFPGKE